MPAGEMRFAAYQVSDDPPVQFTVIPLPMEAGEVLANVNRWEHQLGLPPSPAEKLDTIVKTSTVNGLAVKSVDLSGPESATPRQRMLAAMVPAGGRIWFFKMSGPIEVIGKQKDQFDALIASLKPGSGEAFAGAAPATGSREAGGAQAPEAPAAPAVSMKLSSYHAGEGWKEIPDPKAPRMIAFTVGSDDAKAELIVTRFGSQNTGSFLENINRWRGQMALPAVQDVKNIPMADAQVGKAERAVLITIDNPDAKPAKRMLVVISSIGPDMWFFKLTGPATTIDAQRQAFDAFLKSMEFAPEGDAGEPKP